MDELATGIELFTPVLPNIDDLIDAINSFDEDMWIKNKSTDQESRLADNINFSSIHPKVDPFRDLYEDTVEPLIVEYLTKYNTVYGSKTNITLLRYGKEQGYSDHVDDHPAIARRRISSVFYINDDYEGGSISFPRFGVSLKPEKNSLLLFPSSYTYNHRIEKVTDGFKYCLVTFLA